MLRAGVLRFVIILKGSYLFEMGGLRTLVLLGGTFALYLYALVDVVRKVKQK